MQIFDPSGLAKQIACFNNNDQRSGVLLLACHIMIDVSIPYLFNTYGAYTLYSSVDWTGGKMSRHLHR